MVTDNHQDVIPIFLPIFHNYALEMVLCALYNGSKIVTLPKFEERTFLSTFKQHKVSTIRKEYVISVNDHEFHFKLYYFHY